MDPEKNIPSESEAVAAQTEKGVVEDYHPSPASLGKNVFQKLATAGVELRGLEPVSRENRKHTKYYEIMTLFGGSFMSILPYVQKARAL